ncbi:unnamed protein product [Cylicocyclus nassatus]|uniref:G-protein coupled receptors family 3 profile domain-containing protein n=1 Tax=Cylicocyclus nassatus TaxID=53992 RepID=A0AA36GTD8_CYLNA|nr:unnamed protein product [Cylicocyclus nassatus]
MDQPATLKKRFFFRSARFLSALGKERGVCIEEAIDLKRGSTKMEIALRRLLLTEARVVIVLLGDKNWIELMKALRSELVIAGRFIFFSPQEARWTSSKQFLEQWPHFDQLLLTVTAEKPRDQLRLNQLESKFTRLPFPQHWLKQFWATAFQCHIDGEATPGEQFSKECSPIQMLNVSAITPDVDIAPISIAVTAIAHATRKLVDNICPGALIQRLSDCINDPQDALFSTIHTLYLSHPMSSEPVTFNDTTFSRDHTLIVNRVLFDAQLEYESIARWDHVHGFDYTAASELVMEERDGSRAPLKSTCPRSTCSADVTRRALAGVVPSVKDSLKSIGVLIYAICAGLAFFVCLMCMYQKVVCRISDAYRICTAYTFGGLSMLCLISITFFMAPNPFACFSRKILFPVAVITIFGPIAVKSICIWHADLLTARGEHRQAAVRHSVLTFWVCAAIVMIQIVISSEWAIFESAMDLTYVVSERHGNAWRCTPGNDSEHRIIWSCALSGIMVVVSLVCSTLSVRHSQSRQNILISVLAVMFAAALYISLPLLSFQARDFTCAAMQLTLCFLVIVISYCQQAFASDDNESSNVSLVPSTIGRSQQIQPFWVEASVTLTNSQKQAIYDNYHGNHISATRSEKPGVTVPNISTAKERPAVRQISIAEKYDIPPSTISKYGQHEYAADNDSEEEQNARL